MSEPVMDDNLYASLSALRKGVDNGTVPVIDYEEAVRRVLWDHPTEETGVEVNGIREPDYCPRCCVYQSCPAMLAIEEVEYENPLLKVMEKVGKAQ